MDRQIVYPGAIPLETDLLNTNRSVLSSIGSLIGDTLGTSTQFTGLGCVPSIPAALTFVVNPGVAYSLQNLDNTPYSSLAQDTAHQVMKQGIMANAQTFNTPAPATSGFSINYLLSAAFVEADINPVVLPYYNATNPPQAFSGPGGNGTSNNTTRQNTVQLTLTTGVAATTGSQVTPATPVGQTALYVITVAFGQTTVTAGNIAKVSNAPFFPGFLKADGSVPLTAAQTGVTAPLFDNTSKLATTQFVRASGFSFPGAGVGIATSQTLTASQLGGWGQYQAASLTTTLPPLASTALGSTFTFVGGGFGGTIKGSGTDSIISTLAAPANTLAILPGEVVTVAANGSPSGWFVVFDGVGANSFGVSISANGYQKLPNGLIIEWGATPVLGANASGAITYPLAFPNGIFTLVASGGSTSGGVGPLGTSSNSGSKTGGTVYAGANGALAGGYIAIGY